MNMDVKNNYLKNKRLLELREKIHNQEYMKKAIDKIAAELTVFLYK